MLKSVLLTAAGLALMVAVPVVGGPLIMGAQTGSTLYVVMLAAIEAAFFVLGAGAAVKGVQGVVKARTPKRLGPPPNA